MRGSCLKCRQQLENCTDSWYFILLYTDFPNIKNNLDGHHWVVTLVLALHNHFVIKLLRKHIFKNVRNAWMGYLLVNGNTHPLQAKRQPGSLAQ